MLLPKSNSSRVHVIGIRTIFGHRQCVRSSMDADSIRTFWMMCLATSLYCIVFKHLYSAYSGVNRLEALPLCKAPWEKNRFWERQRKTKDCLKEKYSVQKEKVHSKERDQLRHTELVAVLIVIDSILLWYALT